MRVKGKVTQTVEKALTLLQQALACRKQAAGKDDNRGGAVSCLDILRLGQLHQLQIGK
jgi:hypothetical protein